MFSGIRDNKKGLKFLMEVLSKHKTAFIVIVASWVLSGIFSVIIPYISKLELDQLQLQNTELFWLITWSPWIIFVAILWIVAFTKIIQWLINDIFKYFQSKVFKIMWDDLKIESYKRLKNIEVGLFLNKRNTDVISEASGMQSIVTFIEYNLSKLVSDLVFLFWIFAILSAIDFKIFFVVFISALLLYLIDKKVNYYRSKHYVSENYLLKRKTDVLDYYLRSNVHSMYISGGINLALNQIDQFTKESRKITLELEKKEAFLYFFGTLNQNFVDFVIKLLIGLVVLAGTESIWVMTMVIMYSSQLQSIMETFFNLKLEYLDFVDTLSKVNLYMALTEENKGKKQRPWSLDRIEIKNLSFSYPNVSDQELKLFEIVKKRMKALAWKRGLYEWEENTLFAVKEAERDSKIKNPTILNNLNFSVKAGEIVWIVWKNGTGKTTLIQLILNFFNSYSWNIKFNWIEWKKIQSEFFYNNFSVITQEPFVISGLSIRDNLTLWVDRDVSDEELYWYLEKYNLKSKVNKLKDKIDSDIWYDWDFSGWEKQLLVLIRIILQDRKVIIFDEWTNQLDAENEAMIMSDLLKDRKDKLVIFVTHRMSTISKADRIYCIEWGTVSSVWSHKELIEEENIYSRFWKTQNS